MKDSTDVGYWTSESFSVNIDCADNKGGEIVFLLEEIESSLPKIDKSSIKWNTFSL